MSICYFYIIVIAEYFIYLPFPLSIIEFMASRIQPMIYPWLMISYIQCCSHRGNILEYSLTLLIFAIGLDSIRHEVLGSWHPYHISYWCCDRNRHYFWTIDISAITKQYWNSQWCINTMIIYWILFVYYYLYSGIYLLLLSSLFTFILSANKILGVMNYFQCPMENYESGFFPILSSTLNWQGNFWVILFIFSIFDIELILGFFFIFSTKSYASYLFMLFIFDLFFLDIYFYIIN